MLAQGKPGAAAISWPRLQQWLRVVLLCSYVLLGNRLMGQRTIHARCNLDSIRNELDKNPGDTLRLRLRQHLSWHYINDGVADKEEMGLELALKNYEEAQALGYDYFYASAGADIAGYYLYKSNVYKAGYYAFKVKPYAERNFNSNQLGNFLHYIIAKINFQVGRYREVIEIDRRALVLYNKPPLVANHRTLVASIYANIGNAFDNLDQADSARWYFAKAYTIYDSLKFSAGLAYVLVNIAETDIKEKKYQKAKTHLEQAIKLAESVNSMGIMSDALSNIAEVQLGLKQYAEAKRLADKSLGIAVKAKSPSDIQDALEVLYKACAGLQQYDTAFTYFKHYMMYRDSIKKEVHARELTELQEQITLQQKEAELKLITRSSNLRLAVVISIAIVVVLAGFIVFFAYRLRMRQAMNSQLQKSKAELQQAFDELQAARNKLLLSEKLALLGQLTAGIAHEVNTPLGVIKTATESTQQFLPRLLTDLAEAVRTLRPEDIARMAELLAVHQPPPKARTTKEERQQRLQLEQQLANAGVAAPDEVAQRLLVAGLGNMATDLMPYLRSPHATQVLEIATLAGQLRQSLGNIGTASDRTMSLVRAMRTYTHTPQVEDATRISLLESVNTILMLYTYDIRLKAKLVTELEADPVVFANSDRLGQIWTNLITNALQAVGDKPQNGAEPQLTIRLSQQNGTARVEVQDNGIGIAPDTMPHIFEPFFTTKPRGKGTGIGLSMCKEIVEAYGGRIWAESKPGDTHFIVELPVAQ
jgi:C4-dicarboxylate-specific signal transduction histidine kinase